MTPERKRIVAVCPGRGTYSKETMGHLVQAKGSRKEVVGQLDDWRATEGWATLSELDAMQKFKPAIHTKGENAAALIFANAKLDFMDLLESQHEIVAVIGNSMGWYLALTFAEVVPFSVGYQIVQNMGSMLKDGLIGGQIIYPIADDQWRVDRQKVELVESLLKEGQFRGFEIHHSIKLGGYRVLAGSDEGIDFLLKELPKDGDFPFQLINHGAFHTPLMRAASQAGLKRFRQEDFCKPLFPLIDGRGQIYSPYSASTKELYHYTFQNQVTETYDFSLSLKLALREFAPDHLVLLGPGGTLGGAIGQSLIQERWQGIASKEDFQSRQSEHPLLISLNQPEQRSLLLGNGV